MIGARGTRVVLCVALVLVAVGARGEEDAVAVGLRRFEAGRARYEAGQYREAITEFEAGYAVLPRPNFLLNLGQSYRQLLDLEHAREKYVAYLAAIAQDAPNRVDVEGLVRDIDRALAARPRPVEAPRPRTFLHRHWWVIPTSIVVAAGAAVGIYFAVEPPGRLGCSDARFGCVEVVR